jgi:hypothetical protein
MNPPSEDIKDVLVDEGVGVFAASSGWSITIAKMIDLPDDMITLYDSGGFDQTALFDGDSIQRPQLDIRVRSTDYETAYQKAVEIDGILNLIRASENDILGPLRYVGMIRSADIFFLNFDDKNRPIFGLTYRILSMLMITA